MLGDHQIIVTMCFSQHLLAYFCEASAAIALATFVAVPYLLLNLAVLAKCVTYIVSHTELLPNWRAGLQVRGHWTGIMLASALIFPNLALGLSGFETGVGNAADSRAR